MLTAGRIWGQERCAFACVAMETMVTSERRRSHHEPGKDLGWREISKHYNKQENLDTIIENSKFKAHSSQEVYARVKI